MKNKNIIVFVSLLMVLVVSCTKRSTEEKVPYIHNEGKIQGTFYTATYLQPDSLDLQKKMEDRLHEFDLSLSTYNPQSIISQINENKDSVKTDVYFETMFKAAQEVSKNTNGAFDITVAPLVYAWGFGSGSKDRTKRPNVAEILPYIGFHKVRLENHHLLKSDSRIMLDANAIAQGYSTDIIAELLEDNGCVNYMIEIGGEIVCKGVNPKGEKWRIGIDKPIDDPASSTNELQTIVSISDIALTTSGNYRQFYYKGGKKYAHTIDPRSGYPVVHNLLSATVVAPTCMQADAYATAFMVLGVDSSMQICKRDPQMDCYLIYVDEDGKNQVIYTDGFKKYLTQ